MGSSIQKLQKQKQNPKIWIMPTAGETSKWFLPQIHQIRVQYSQQPDFSFAKPKAEGPVEFTCTPDLQNYETKNGYCFKISSLW